MVAPLILVILIGSGIFITLFTPVGDLIFDQIPGTPKIEIDKVKEETEATASDSLGIEKKIMDGFDGIADFIKAQTDIESLDLPNNPTNEELDAVIDSQAGIGKAGAGLYFAVKKAIESLVNLTSPIGISIVIVGIISSIVALMLMFGIAKKVTKHLVIFLIIMVAVMIGLMVVGSEIQI